MQCLPSTAPLWRLERPAFSVVFRENTCKYKLENQNTTLIIQIVIPTYTLNYCYFVTLSCVQWIQNLQHHAPFHQVSKSTKLDYLKITLKRKQQQIFYEDGIVLFKSETFQ